MFDLANASSCAIFSFNDEGIILQVNAALSRLLEREASDIVHQKINHIFTIPTLIFFQTHLYPLIKVEQKVDEIFISLKSSSGREIPVVLSGQRLEDEGMAINVFSCITVFNRNSYEAEIIAARKLAEKSAQENSALLAAQEKLQQQVLQLDEQMQQMQQYNETLKEISHAVSHEMQEPVRKLQLYTDIILNHRQSDVPEKDKSKLLYQIDRIKNILMGLQSYVWLEESEVQDLPVDLTEVLLLAREKVVNEEGHHKFSLSHAPLPVLKGNASLLVSMFVYLLRNSIKFKHPERSLQVHVEATLLNINQLKQLADRYAYRPYYKIEYTDNGSGFDPKYSNHIFQLFRKLDANTDGAGIGLALVKKIVLHHGGTITALGKEGAGSSFALFLPATP